MSDKPPLDIQAYHRLTTNGLWVMASNISMAFILILTVLASRVLGDAEFGVYVFLLATGSILSELSVLGTTDYAAILVAREPDRTDRVVANTFGLRLPLIVLYGAAFLGVASVVVPGHFAAGLFVALDWAVRTLIHLYRGVLRSRDAFAVDARVATGERLAVLVIAALALFVTRSLLGFTVGFFVGRLVGLILCLRAYRSLPARFGIGFDGALWRSIVRGGLPIGVRGLLRGVSFRIDAVMLGMMRGEAEVGWYGAAYKFLEASFFFTEAVSSAFQPAIARAYGLGQPATIGDLYGRGYKILLIVGGALAAVGFVHAGTIVPWVFGDDFSPGSAALQILVWAMLFAFAYMKSIGLLDAIDAGRRTLVPFVVATVANVGLNLWLIPAYGLIGAAWSTLVTEALLAVALLGVSIRLGYLFPVRWIVGPLVACAGFTAIALALANRPLIGTLAGLTVFGVVLGVGRVFDTTDRDYARYLLAGLRRR